MPGRGNGLTAASYVALTDLEPQLADAVLDTLRTENIAAYAAPATDRPLSELTAERKLRPLDRVFVDRAASARARVVLDAELPRLRAQHEADHPLVDDTARGAVDDDVWAGIVAAFSSSAPPEGERRWPDIEDLAPEPGTDPAASGPAPGADSSDGGPASDPGPERAGDAESGDGAAPRSRLLRPAAGSGRDAGASGPTGATGATGATDDHFVPPPPPPLPRLDGVAKAAWTGVLGAPIALVLVVILRLDVGRLVGLLLVGSFVAGFVTLVARMKDDPDDDDGWHDGAVV